MPQYCYKCPQCGVEIKRILSPAEAKEPQQCKECHAVLRRAPRPPTSQVMESLDNGFMTKRVERLSEAPRIFHEHVKGKKTAI